MADEPTEVECVQPFFFLQRHVANRSRSRAWRASGSPIAGYAVEAS